MPDNISDERRKLLERMPRPAKLRFRWDERRGVAATLRGDLGKAVGIRPGLVDPPALATEKFVRNYGALIGPGDLWDRVTPLALRTDKLRFVHLDYQVRHPSGIEVYGARVVAHFDVQRRL